MTCGAGRARRTYRRCVLRSLCLAAIALATVVPAAAASPSDDHALGRALATRFWELTRDQDHEGLRAFLSPAFQSQAFGERGAAKRAYIDSVGRTVVVADFLLTRFTVTRKGRTLVARFTAVTTEVIGTVLFTSAPSRRLETFVQDGNGWHITSNANFALPSTSTSSTAARTPAP